VPVVWGNVPQRNKNFTGRHELLIELRKRVTGDVTAVLAHALHGMGGVGKTHLAVEYAYRYMGDYDVIWWIPSDQIPLVRSSLASLAPRLGLGDVSPGRLEDSVRAVLEALRRGKPYERWLVIFDNADQPEEIRDLLPSGPGHVIVTSRNHRWQSVADAVEVDVFSRQESLDFLARRVPGITHEESVRLADELGDLPLALEQAGALQVESGMSVDEYLELLAEQSSQLLAESPPADYPLGVAAAWSLSMARLRDVTPFAWELLRRLAYFGPEPIDRDLFKNGRYVLGPPLQSEIGDPIVFGRAIRELGRYALARVDNYHKTLQVHRLIQRLIRDEIDEDQAEIMQHEVHQLLAAADPDEPDGIEHWPRYDQLLAHVVPSQAVLCRFPEGRRLVRNVIRYVFNVGDLTTCDALSSAALDSWTTESGPDDPDVLILSGQRADLLWRRGAYDEAYELRQATLERMRRVFGEEHEETLQVTNAHGADLRARGEFAKALELDRKTLDQHIRVFTRDNAQTLNVANNLAVDQVLNSKYDSAYDTDTQTHQDRLDFFGRDDHPWVIFSLGATGRDLRHRGRYADALPIAEQAHGAYGDLIRQRVLPADHAWVLWQAKELSVARRKMGLLEPALELAEEVYQRYVVSFPDKHPDLLAAGIALGNARRVLGEINQDDDLLERADAQIESAHGSYGDVYGPDHPYTRGCAVNLAIVRRRVGGDAPGAVQILRGALASLSVGLGDRHHYTLTCMTELATSLSSVGETEEARNIGEASLQGLRAQIGEDHPHTLATASNLAVDLRTLGEVDAADALAGDTIARYEAILPADHLDVLDARQGERIALDLEPVPL
jgi:tetratricopeptide (TPR) repeat protein